MEKFSVNGQTYIIDNIVSHIKNGHMGLAFAKDWDYERNGDTVYFTLKKGGEIKPDVIFWFGYLTNQ